MKKILFLIILMSFPLALMAQEEALSVAAEGIAKQLRAEGADKKILAVSYFTNSQGYGPHYSEVLGDALGDALVRQGLNVVKRSDFGQIVGEQNLSGTQMFDAKWVRANVKLASADIVAGGKYEVKNEDVVITIQLLDVASGRILVAPDAVKIPRTPGVIEELNYAAAKSFSDAAAAIGLDAIESGKYKTEENERLIKAIESATRIKILVVNGDNVFQTFKKEFHDFLAKDDAEMQVLFGTADSDFYREETQMTQLISDPNNPAYKANQAKVEFNRSRLLGLAETHPSRVHIRYFDTQYRMPIIIIGDRCFLTLRLSPNESQQSVRLEFAGGPDSFAKSCVAHFNAMWDVSSEIPLQSARPVPHN